MAKKDKKSKAAEQKARVAAKQTKKAAQKEKKGRSKGGEESDAEDVDLESMLEEYTRKVNSAEYLSTITSRIKLMIQQAQFLKVTETPCDPPSARSAATMVGSPSNSKELFVFGGEYYNGILASFFNDLLVYHVDKDEWKNVTSPNSPLPRSGHAWCRGGNAGGIYLFGGEFSSPKQGTFYHYNDFWRLEPSTREWTRLETKGKSPPARSGHRMTYYKNYIILYGGFQDTSQQTKYLQDLWLYDCQNFAWHNPVLPSATQKPDARSSFSFHPHDRGAVLYGGYSRVKSNFAAIKQSKGGFKASKSVITPVIHQDTWHLRITPPATDGPVDIPQVRWERRKKPVNSPNPPRAGVTQVFHKGRGVMFGGVHDVEESEEGIDSEFFDQLYAWNIERNRFFPLALRRARAMPKKHVDDRGKRGRGKADEVELLRNLAALEQQGNLSSVDKMDVDASDDKVHPTRPAKPILNTMPHRRYNAQLAVQGDVLYIFGGTFEQSDREYTFDDMYAIDLGKLDGVQELYKREIENWQGEDEASDSDSEDDDSEDEAMDGGSQAGVPLPKSEIASQTENVVPVDHPIDETEEEQPDAILNDNKPHPRPFESLRDFFARTSAAWQELVLEALQQQGNAANQSVKELRRNAFELAEIKWWDCREEIYAEEERQEAADIGEVVSLADRIKDGGGAGRRR